MITASDSFSTYDMGKYYVILPQLLNWNLQEYLSHFKAKRVPAGFNYTSGENPEWLTVKDLRKLIVDHIDPDFTITEK